MKCENEDRPEINCLEDFVGELVWRKMPDGSRRGPYLVVKDPGPGKVAQLARMGDGELSLPDVNDVFYLDTQHRLIYTRD
jgi:hypothetical protein